MANLKPDFSNTTNTSNNIINLLYSSSDDDDDNTDDEIHKKISDKKNSNKKDDDDDSDDDIIILDPFATFGPSSNDNGIITNGILSLFKTFILNIQKTSLLSIKSTSDNNSRLNPPLPSPCCRDIHSVLSSSFFSSNTAAPFLVHIQQRDKHTCGYRNLQQVLSSLLHLLPCHHTLFIRLGIPSPTTGCCCCSSSSSPSLNTASSSTNNNNKYIVTLPTITQIQLTIENSWSYGYDVQGALHYHHSLVGSKAFIGAMEFASLFQYLQVDVCVVQFMTCIESRILLGPFLYFYFLKNNNNTRKRKSTTSATTPTIWACKCCDFFTSKSLSLSAIKDRVNMGLQYAVNTTSTTTTTTATTFSSSNRSCCTCIYPVYLQWEGHSITVIGIEKISSSSYSKMDDYNLFVLDPMKNFSSSSSSTTTTTTTPSKLLPFLLPISQLYQKDIQIILVTTHSFTTTSSSNGDNDITEYSTKP